MKGVASALLLGLAAALPGAAAAAGAPAQLAALTGDCNADPGVALVAAFAQGQPVVPPNELTPRPGWVLFMHPTVPTLSFYHPADWQPAPFSQIGAVGVRVMSPDGSAGFAIFNTTNPAGAANAQQVAEQGLRNLIGGGSASLVCGFDLPVPGVIPTTSFFEAVATQTSVAVAVGTVFHDPASGAPVAIDHRTIMGPRDQFAALARGVFLPVFTQLLQSSAGAGEEDDGGGDDDGDGEGDGDGG